MQIKQVKNRVQLLRYVGFNPETKHSVAKFIGSFSYDTLELADELKSEMTSEELAEVETWIHTTRWQREHEALIQKAEDLPDVLKTLTQEMLDRKESFLSDLDAGDDWGDRTWRSIVEFQKALKRVGCPRPKGQQKG